MDMMKVMFKHWSRGFLSLVFVSSCWCLLIEDGTCIIIMNLAQNVLLVLSKCVCLCGGRGKKKGTSTGILDGFMRGFSWISIIRRTFEYVYSESM